MFFVARPPAPGSLARTPAVPLVVARNTRPDVDSAYARGNGRSSTSGQMRGRKNSVLQRSMTPFGIFSDKELIAEASRLAMCERQATAALIRCLMEVDARRLYLGEGCSSLFTFCTQALHLSEHAALGRIEVARAARRLPALLAHLEDGSLTVTNARMLAPHMTEGNCDELLAAARHCSKREVEEIVARLRPQPDVRSAVHKLSAPRAPEKPLAPTVSVPVSNACGGDATRPNAVAGIVTPGTHRSTVAALAPERYKIQFTASRGMHDK